MPAIERIDREQIEDEQAGVDIDKHPQEMARIRKGVCPAHAIGGHSKDQRHRKEHEVDERSCGDGPEGSAGTRRWGNVGHTTKRPEDNLVGLTASLATG